MGDQAGIGGNTVISGVAMEKKCIRCELTLPADEFYADRNGADGRLTKCKSCCRSDARARREEFADKSGEPRYCTRCCQMKPPAAFYRRATMKDGFTNQCRSCVATYQAEYQRKRKAGTLQEAFHRPEIGRPTSALTAASAARIADDQDRAILGAKLFKLWKALDKLGKATKGWNDLAAGEPLLASLAALDEASEERTRIKALRVRR